MVALGVLIVDDNARFRARARRMLEAGGYRVLAEASDGASALECVRRHRPGVVLLDVQLPDMSGVTVAEQLAREPHPPAVVLTSMLDAADLGERLTRAPVRGFVPKCELSPEAIAALL